MRTIKFRAWDKTNEVMVVVSDIDFSDNSIGIISQDRQLQQKDFILMQYTELQDKNGKEIYHHDIVRDRHGNVCEVVWRERFCHWGIWMPSDTTHPECNPRDLSYAVTKMSQLEIIGNVFENPELLA